MELRLSNFGIIFEKQKLGTLRTVTIIFVGVTLSRVVPYVGRVYLLYNYVVPY